MGMAKLDSDKRRLVTRDELPDDKQTPPEKEKSSLLVDGHCAFVKKTNNDMTKLLSGLIDQCGFILDQIQHHESYDTDLCSLIELQRRLLHLIQVSIDPASWEARA